METFGQKLKRAVDEHGLTIEDVARATGLDIVHLRALARDDLATIPADDSITDGLEALARLVGVEPDEVIADYERERMVEETLTPTEPAVSIVPEPPPLPVEETHSPASKSAGWPGRIAAVAIALTLTVAGVLWFRSAGPQDVAPVDAMNTVETAGGIEASGAPTPSATVESVPAEARVEEAPTSIATPESIPAVMEAEGTSSPSVNAESVSEAARSVSAPTPGRLAIPHHGVGTGVVNRTLVGAGERFAEGTRVWFWTWVEGATAGDVIRHVWIHEGREMLSTPLNLGGPRWRTQSYKNLHPGSTGEWVVEARDSAGLVLARQVFQCFKSSSS